jgi:glycerol-3-phosphate dehydrogenase (NAD(P)+)
MKISVVGAGAWGTTIAILLAQKEHQVTLWVYEAELAQAMHETRENKTFLPGFQLPENIKITNKEADLAGSEMVFFVVPTQFLRSVVKRCARQIGQKAIVVAASKGIEETSLKLPLEIIRDEIRSADLVALSGPNLSREIANGQPAAAVVAGKNIQACRQVQQAIMQERFRVYVNPDPIGVQLGGALKNVIAIAAGVADGLELGNNSKSALIIRGVSEISRLGVAMGANTTTFAGLSGMGDLITTCSSRLSRNHSVGEQIAKGKKLKAILACMKDVAEGVPTAKAAIALGHKHKVELPVCREVYATLYEGKSPLASITDLMTRSATSE